MATISDNHIKSKGVSAIELALGSTSVATISVRGQARFVVMDMAHYRYLRERELDAALAQTRADLAAGRMVQESPEAHVARLNAVEQDIVIMQQRHRPLSLRPRAAANTHRPTQFQL